MIKADTEAYYDNLEAFALQVMELLEANPEVLKEHNEILTDIARFAYDLDLATLDDNDNFTIITED